MPIVLIDVFESPEIERGLRRCGLNVQRISLVNAGVADLFWYGHGDTRFTLEHKTVSQVVAEMGKRLDTQLRKHSQNADDVGLIMDGVAVPNLKHGGTDFYREVESAKGKRIYVKSGHSAIHYEAFTAYLWRLEKEGFAVYSFPNVEALCLGVASFVFNSQKAEHSTLRRYAKTKPVLWKPDPHIQLLVSLPTARIGEKTANKIIDHYGSPYAFFADSLEGMEAVVGLKTAVATMKDLGRLG